MKISRETNVKWGNMKRRHSKKDQAELANNHACYILITCDKAQSDGNMEVKMTYEGDPTLASYLLEGAQSMIDEQVMQICNGTCKD